MPSKTPLPYEMVGRTGYSRSSTFSLSKDRLIKLAAVVVVAFVAISALQTLFTKGNVVYGLMIDAGSTGSRIHTYTFQTQGTGELKLLGEDFLPIKPGLSAFKDSPSKAAASLEPLLQRAKKIVPTAAHASTPIVLRATAGLRMVGEDVANDILAEVRTYLRSSGFRFESDDWATILGGNDESLYTWITVNYLLNRAADNTVGTLEMGGGSSQAAFVPREVKAPSANCTTPSEKMDYKDRHMDLYAVSHLNFGLQKARAIAFEAFQANGQLGDNPCVNKGKPVIFEIPFDEAGNSVSLTGAGDYQSCRALIDTVVVKPALQECHCDVCTYHGAAQPHPIPEYVAIAFYLGRTVAIGLQTPLTVKDIREKGEEVCALTVDEVKSKYPAVPNGDATDLCMDLAFIVSHLEIGHGLMENLHIKLMVLDKIDGVELGWSLGAMQQTMSTLGIGK